MSSYGRTEWAAEPSMSIAHQMAARYTESDEASDSTKHCRRSLFASPGSCSLMPHPAPQVPGAPKGLAQSGEIRKDVLVIATQSVYRQYAQVEIPQTRGGVLRLTLDRDAEHETSTQVSLGRGFGRCPVYSVTREYRDLDDGEGWTLDEFEVITGPVTEVMTEFELLVDIERRR